MARDRVGTEIGTYLCWCCTKEVPVRQKAEEAGGSISAACMWCNFSNTARRGTNHYKKLLNQVQRTAPVATSEPQPAAVPVETAAAAAAADDKPADIAKTAAGAEVTKTATKGAPPARSFTGPLFGGGK